MQKKMIWLSLSVVILGFMALFFWMKPNSNHTQTTSLANASNTTTSIATANSATSENSSQQTNFASPSQQDTEINCQLPLNQVGKLIVNEQTKNCFEYFITQYGEKEISQIDQDFRAYLQKNYTAPALNEIQDLWSRYLQYRQSLGDLKPSNTDKNTTAYYVEIFSEMKNLRKKHFSTIEIEGLFGTEDSYNEYTLQRMQVLEDQSLNPTEKAKKLKTLFEQLPKDWQENLEQINKLDDLKKLSQEIKKRGGSSEELRQMRLNLVGAEATQRLETLDIQRSDWKNRVNQYLSKRENIMQSTMSQSAKDKAIQQLRQQSFNNSTEQLRLETFETVHDQGGKLPFVE